MKRAVVSDGPDVVEDTIDRKTLFGRMLSLKRLNEYIPMTLSRDFFEAFPNINGLHNYVNCSLDTLCAIVREKYSVNGKQVSLWPGPGNRWATNLMLLGYSSSEAALITEDSVDYGKAGKKNNLQWFCFYTPELPREPGKGTLRVQELYERGVGSAHVRAFQLAEGKLAAQYWSTLKSEPVPVTPVHDEAHSEKKSKCEVTAVHEESPPARATLDALEVFAQSELYSRRFIDLDLLQSASASTMSEIDPFFDAKLAEVVALQKKPGGGGCHILEVGSMTYYGFPRFRGEDPKTVQRKAQCLSLAFDAVGGIDTDVATSLCRREPEAFSEGASRAGLQVGSCFNAEETAQVFGDLSKSAQKYLLAAMKSKGVNVFTSLRKVEVLRQDLVTQCVRSKIGMAATGSKGSGKVCKAVFVGLDMFELVSCMLRLATRKGKYDFGFRLGDAEVGRTEIVGVYSQDKGAESIKGFFHLPAVEDPCSIMNTRATWVIECLSINQKLKPNDHPDNWEEAIALCYGYNDWPLTICVQVSNEFLFVPRQSVLPSREIPTVPANDNDRKSVEDHRAGIRQGSAADEEMRRSNSRAGTAVLISFEGRYLGARVDGNEPDDFIYFSFFEPPAVGQITLHNSRALFCADLLSACAGDGMIDTSNSSCVKCDFTPPEFKVAMQDPDSPLKLRTHESQAACYAEYLAQEGTKKAVHGVNGKPLYPNIRYEDRIEPVLHLDLGIINKFKELLEQYLGKLGTVDPAAAEEVRQLRETIECFSEIIDKHISNIETGMNECPDLLGVEDDEPGTVARSKLDGAMNGALIVGDPFYAEPYSHFFQDALTLIEKLENTAIQVRSVGDRRERGDPRLVTRGRREVLADEAKADALEEAAQKIDEELAELLSALSALQESQAELDALDPTGDVGGPVLAKFKCINEERKIIEESYWGNCLNGGSARKFLHSGGEIIAELKLFMTEKGYSAAQIHVLDLHAAAMAPYSELSKLMRSTEMYSDAQIDSIRANARQFGIAFRQAHGIDSMFPKAHMAERHIPEVASRLRTLGRLSEEGGEAYHVGYKKAAALCRTIKNQEGRVRATLRHMQNKQNVGFFSRSIRTRTSAKARAAAAPAVAVAPALEMAAAGAAAAAPAPLPAGSEV